MERVVPQGPFAVGTDVKMTSVVVRKLAAKGLLARKTDPRDTRARRLRVTPGGERVARQAIVAVEAADQAFFRPARSEGLDSDRIAALLRRLAEAP
jgi:DNA-binding MarR family transcriptional regulator